MKSIKLICIKPGYEGRTYEADRETEDGFVKDIRVYEQPGVAIYPKEYFIQTFVEECGGSQKTLNRNEVHQT